DRVFWYQSVRLRRSASVSSRVDRSRSEVREVDRGRGLFGHQSVLSWCGYATSHGRDRKLVAPPGGHGCVARPIRVALPVAEYAGVGAVRRSRLLHRVCAAASKPLPISSRLPRTTKSARRPCSLSAS